MADSRNTAGQGAKVAPYGWLKAKAVYMNSLEQMVEDTLEVPLLSRESTISRVENTLRNWADYRGFKTSAIVVDFEGTKFKFKELRTKWKMISTRISYTELKGMEDGEELKDKVKNLKSNLMTTKMNIGYMPEACIEKLDNIKTQVEEVEDIVAKLLGDESFRTKLATTIKEG